MENIITVAKHFGVSKKEALDAIRGYSGGDLYSVLKTPSILFDAAEAEIYETEKRLRGYVYALTDLVVSNHIPFDYHPRVYFLFDDSMLIYIGKTKDIASRISSHLKTRSFSGVATEICDIGTIDVVEEINIMHHTPRENKQVLSKLEFFKKVLGHCFFE